MLAKRLGRNLIELNDNHIGFLTQAAKFARHLALLLLWLVKVKLHPVDSSIPSWYAAISSGEETNVWMTP